MYTYYIIMYIHVYHSVIMTTHCSIFIGQAACIFNPSKLKVLLSLGMMRQYYIVNLY